MNLIHEYLQLTKPRVVALLGGLLVAQVCLGIANVKLALPLHVAVLHNAGAALLLFVLVGLVARVRAPGA